MANLCTQDQVKDYMKLASKDMDNDVIDDLISRITTQFENYCGVEQFDQKTYTEYHDGGDNHVFPTANVPILSITSLYDDPEWTWGSDTLIAATDYRIVNSKYVVSQVGFVDTEQNIKITFSGGYATIPTDLVQAAVEETGRKFKHRLDFDDLNKTVADGTVDYVEPGLMKSTKSVLNFYKNEWVV